MAQPAERLVIHEQVCEGCGDCAKKSNCASLERVQTWAGEKMRIHQSSCNADLTCAFGDCPSFLSLPAARALPGSTARRGPPAVPDPSHPEPAWPYRILMPGIGGTGVVTVNAILATAALRDGLAATTLDQTGLAQKGGAVTSHLTLSRERIATTARIVHPDAVLAFDPAGAPGECRIVVKNSAIPGGLSIDASRIAQEYLGNHLLANILLMGYAWQAGLIPISRRSIEESIRLNGVEVEANLDAFHWGRASFVEPPSFARETAEFDPVAELTAFQDSTYARTYSEFVAATPEAVREIVARHLYRLMAYKDEYEVARLLTKSEYKGAAYHLHPPFLRALGFERKMKFGPWFRPILKALALFKFLRGTPFDPFGYARHRREERALVSWYKDLVRRTQGSPDAGRIADLPTQIRGYGEIKSQSIHRVRKLAEEACAREPVQVS
jgi:indolepyruvate ferredoxin oxidoreductase